MRSLAIPMTMKEGSDDWYSPVQAPGRVYFMYTKRKVAVADMSSVQTKDGLRDRDDHFFYVCLQGWRQIYWWTRMKLDVYNSM